MPKSSTIFVNTLFNCVSPFCTLFIFSVVSVCSNFLVIKIFFSAGIFFASKNASIFLTNISPSVFPFSMEDLKSVFSSGATFPGTPIVE